MTFENFLFIATALYICQVAIFLYGMRRPRDRQGSNATPFISVVIAARNEEHNLPLCLDSLCSQTYPQTLFEVIIVNDHSSDLTESVCSQYAEHHPNITCVNSRKDPHLRGKANALACGIDEARGEIILITDADCIVPDTWIEHTVKRYHPNIGLIGGITLQHNTTWFDGMQSLDWAYILGAGASTAALGMQHGSIGNNLSFRKKAYDEVGGYRGLKFSITEDYTIVQAIINSGTWDYLYPIDPKLLVESKPCPDLVTLMQQKHRWGKGGLDMKVSGFLIMTVAFLMHVSPFIMLYWGKVVLVASMLMIKFVMDYLFLNSILKKLDRTSELRWFYYFEIYFMLYTIILPFLVFFGGKVKWKGRNY